jgi:hypothetical protein
MLTAVQSLRLACSEGASSEERGAREGAKGWSGEGEVGG